MTQRLIVKVKRQKKKSKESVKNIKKFKGNHNAILKHSLKLLIDDLLPLAVTSYSKSPKQGAAYAVTNIISEIRGTIQQIEAAVDADKILAAVSQEIVLALRVSINRMVGHITFIKEGLPLKVNNPSLRRDITVVLDGIMKEYESNMTEAITDIELRIAKVINEIVKGNQPRKKLKRKKN